MCIVALVFYQIHTDGNLKKKHSHILIEYFRKALGNMIAIHTKDRPHFINVYAKESNNLYCIYYCISVVSNITTMHIR